MSFECLALKSDAGKIDLAVGDLRLGGDCVEGRTCDVIDPEEQADTVQGVPNETPENVLGRLIVGE